MGLKCNDESPVCFSSKKFIRSADIVSTIGLYPEKLVDNNV